MKSIYKILLLFACSCGVSCGGDDEPAMTALAVQGIRAEAFPGAIRLTWNPVENSDFLYTEVSYYDFGTQSQCESGSAGARRTAIEGGGSAASIEGASPLRRLAAPILLSPL